MEIKHKNFDIIIAEDYEDMSQIAADKMAAKIVSKPDASIGFATGATPIRLYEKLIERHKGGLSFASISGFSLDEYYPINKDNEQSYAYFMHTKLYNHVDMQPQNIFIPNGESNDVLRECREYEHRIIARGGIDLQLLGLGLNGHIGFNEPADVFPKATHYVDLTKSTIEANAYNFKDINDMPKKAITMGIGTIMQAKEVLLLISGGKKAGIAHQAIHGDIDPQVPGSILQLHPKVTIVIDKAAAEKLEL